MVWYKLQYLIFQSNFLFVLIQFGKINKLRIFVITQAQKIYLIALRINIKHEYKYLLKNSINVMTFLNGINIFKIVIFLIFFNLTATNATHIGVLGKQHVF